MTTKTAALYVRISFDKNKDEAGVDRQQADTRLLAESKGWEVTEVYPDNDASATRGTRPEFERLLKDIEAGRVSRVVVWHMDRLVRTMKDLTRLIEVGKPHRLNVASVRGMSIDLSDPTGVAVAQIITAISGMEVAHKGERQERAHQDRVQEGRPWWARKPFGFTRDGEVIEEEAELIREAYAMLLRGESIRNIVRKLEATSTEKWYPSRVNKLLKAERNAGLMTYKGEVVGRGAWEPIVDEGTYYATVAIMNEPSRRNGGRPRHSLLSGVLFCDRCEGGRMHRDQGFRKDRGYSYDHYRCGKCHFEVNTEWAETLVVESVHDFFLEGDAEVPEDNSHDDYLEEMRALQSRLDGLTDAYASEQIDLRTLTRGSAALKDKIAALQAKAAESAVNTRLATREDLRANWARMSTDEQRATLARYWVFYAGKGEDGKRYMRGEPTGFIDHV
jgi:DNA invertase Pin-like site-specific DNA recombinase